MHARTVVCRTPLPQERVFLPSLFFQALQILPGSTVSRPSAVQNEAADRHGFLSKEHGAGKTVYPRSCLLLSLPFSLSCLVVVLPRVIC